MSITGRPTLQQLVTASMEGAVSNIKLATEAKRQQEHTDKDACEKCGKDPCTCTAKKASASGSSSASVDKLANALDYLAKYQLEQAEEEKKASASTTQGPGKGPGALTVLESSKTTRLPEHTGQATPHGVVPMHPGTEKATPQDHSATAMETNDKTPPGGGGKTPEKVAAADLEKKNLERVKEAFLGGAGGRVGGMGGAKSMFRPPTAAPAGGTSAAVAGVAKNLQNASPFQARSTQSLVGNVAGGPPAGGGTVDPAAAAAQMQSGTLRGALAGMGAKMRGLFGGMGGGVPAGGMVPKMAGSPEEQLVFKNLGVLAKLAEDAINPAKISAGPATPSGATAAGEGGGGEPAGGAPQGPTGLIGSNENAINFTRREAYANRIADMAKWLTQPMDSAKHDSTLQTSFEHTREAGPKVASVKTAAARVVLADLIGKAG